MIKIQSSVETGGLPLNSPQMCQSVTKCAKRVEYEFYFRYLWRQPRFVIM